MQIADFCQIWEKKYGKLSPIQKDILAASKDVKKILQYPKVDVREAVHHTKDVSKIIEILELASIPSTVEDVIINRPVAGGYVRQISDGDKEQNQY